MTEKADTRTVPHATWTINASKKEKGWKVIAISPDRKRVIHQERLTEEEVESFDPEFRWTGKKAPNIVDFAADVNTANPQKGAA